MKFAALLMKETVPKGGIVSFHINDYHLIIFLTSFSKLSDRVRVMVFNATFNNISVISWKSVLLVEENGVYLEKPPTCCKSLTHFISKCCIEYTPHDTIESSPMIPVLLNFHCLKFLYIHQSSC